MMRSYEVIVLLFFAWFTSFARSSPPIEELAYQRLVQIVNSNPSPKGVPFPDRIPSPKCNHRVGIVGAGPAGIHMAYLLKKKGYKNVVILEKSDRVGGMSCTVQNRRVLHEMGTCYSQPDYKENLIALAKEFGLWQPVDIPSANIRQDKSRTPITYKEFAVGEVMKILGTQNATAAKIALFSAMINYALLHRKMFGRYDGELMRRPYRNTMKNLRGTFYEFLKRHNLDVLKPIFVASHTIQGYGHLDEISAIYGLMWNTPNFLKALAEKLLDKPDHLLTMIRGGFQNLWKTIALKERLNIRLHTNIIKVIRRRTAGVWVYDSHGRCRTFHFLIWTASLYSNRPFQYSEKEKQIFSKLRPIWFTTTLFNSSYGIRGISPIDYWIDNIENKREHYVWAQRDSFGTLQDLQGKAYKDGLLAGGPDGKFVRTGVLYQYGKRKPKPITLSRNAEWQLRKTQARQISMIQQRTWEYFPKFSPKHMAKGVIWEIIKLQGRQRTWFAGSSVIFESVKSVLEYNKLLVSKIPKAIQDRCRKGKLFRA